MDLATLVRRFSETDRARLNSPFEKAFYVIFIRFSLRVKLEEI